VLHKNPCHWRVQWYAAENQDESPVKVRVLVSDSLVNQILEDISNSLGQHAGNEAHGMIFIKDVYDAYEIGTKQRGEDVLVSK
jgi:nitrogen regulatory protein P-II 1